MNDPNDLIDRILSTLNETPTPTGLEHRVLQRVRTRTSHLTPRTWIGTLRALAAAPPFRIATAAATASILAATFAVRHHTPTESSTPLPQTPSFQSTTASQPPAAQTPRPPRTPRLQFADASVYTPARSPAPDLATLEMRAPSLPPPTLPLTADERLMQTIARHAELPQLAELHIPSPPAAAIAPIFAGFAARPSETPPSQDDDPTSSLTIDHNP